MNVIMAEFKDVRHDARVLKQAHSLVNHGYNVNLLMINASIKRNRRRKENKLTYLEYSFPQQTKTSNSMERKLRLAAAIKKIVEMYWYILSHKADVYHAHNLKYLFICVLSSLMHGGKVVYDAHELHSAKHPPDGIKNRMLNKFNYFYEKFMLNFVDLFIEASDERAEYVADLYHIPKPLVIENHINKIELNGENQIIKEKLNLLNSETLLIYVGGIRLGKGRSLERVIEALGYLDVCIHFILMGPATNLDRENIIKCAKQYNVADRVHILDPVSYQEVVTTISSADVSIIPLYADSLNIRMSALNKISESCMAGLPIAASNYENLKRIINENPVGRIGENFDESSTESIVDAINNCLKPRNKRRYSANAFNLAQKFYNWENEEKKLIDAYGNLRSLDKN